jgi:hypothetical protein
MRIKEAVKEVSLQVRYRQAEESAAALAAYGR